MDWAVVKGLTLLFSLQPGAERGSPKIESMINLLGYHTLSTLKYISITVVGELSSNKVCVNVSKLLIDLIQDN